MKTVLLTFMLVFFVFSLVSKNSPAGEEAPEPKISAIFFGEDDKFLGEAKASPLNKEYGGYFIPVPPDSESFFIKVNSSRKFFYLEELEGASVIINEPDFAGFVDFLGEDEKMSPSLFIFQ